MLDVWSVISPLNHSKSAYTEFPFIYRPYLAPLSGHKMSPPFLLPCRFSYSSQMCHRWCDVWCGDVVPHWSGCIQSWLYTSLSVDDLIPRSQQAIYLASHQGKGIEMLWEYKDRASVEKTSQQAGLVSQTVTEWVNVSHVYVLVSLLCLI